MAHRPDAADETLPLHTKNVRKISWDEADKMVRSSPVQGRWAQWCWAKDCLFNVTFLESVPKSPPREAALFQKDIEALLNSKYIELAPSPKNFVKVFTVNEREKKRRRMIIELPKFLAVFNKRGNK